MALGMDGAARSHARSGTVDEGIFSWEPWSDVRNRNHFPPRHRRLAAWPDRRGGLRPAGTRWRVEAVADVRSLRPRVPARRRRILRRHARRPPAAGPGQPRDRAARPRACLRPARGGGKFLARVLSGVRGTGLRPVGARRTSARRRAARAPSETHRRVAAAFRRDRGRDGGRTGQGDNRCARRAFSSNSSATSSPPTAPAAGWTTHPATPAG